MQNTTVIWGIRIEKGDLFLRENTILVPQEECSNPLWLVFSLPLLLKLSDKHLEGTSNPASPSPVWLVESGSHIFSKYNWGNFTFSFLSAKYSPNITIKELTFLLSSWVILCYVLSCLLHSTYICTVLSVLDKGEIWNKKYNHMSWKSIKVVRVLP